MELLRGEMGSFSCPVYEISPDPRIVRCLETPPKSGQNSNHTLIHFFEAMRELLVWGVGAPSWKNGGA